jgi:transposase
MSCPIQLRPITDDEGATLKRTVRKGRDAIARKRAACILSAAQGKPVPEIARAQLLHETYVRKILHAFNAEGIKSLGARYGIGRPRQITEEQCRKMVAVALTPPEQLRQPFGVWSLPKLRDYLIAQKVVVTISDVHLGRILRREGLSVQRTKTWKQSNDPDYARKKSGWRSQVKRRSKSVGG